MSKQRTINVKPYHCETECDSTGFILVFFCDADKKIRIHMGYWWVTYIARALWQAVKKQRQMVSYNENALTRGVE